MVQKKAEKDTMRTEIDDSHLGDKALKTEKVRSPSVAYVTWLVPWSSRSVLAIFTLRD